MSHKNKPSLTLQVKSAFDSMLKMGTKSHRLPRDERCKIINSWVTYRTYVQQSVLFTKWCKNHYKCKTLDDCKNYANEYLESLSDKSPSTQHTAVSSLKKLYQSYGKDSFITFKAPQRHRRDIIRSRGMEQRSYEEIERANADKVALLKCLGLRRCETPYITDKNFFKKDDVWYIKVFKNTKGGKPREALVLGDAETIYNTFKSHPDTPLLKNLDSKLDVHSYRGDYATSLYFSLLEDKKIPSEHQYKCRGDRYGIILDRRAMLTVSRCLGHERITVIASNYLKI